MKNIFSRFIAKSLLGLTLIVAPAAIFAQSIDALGTSLPNQSGITVYWNAGSVPAGVNSYRIAYRVSGSSYWSYTAWNSSALYVYSGPFANMNARSRAVTGLQVGTAYDFEVWGMNTTNGSQYGSDVVYGSTSAQSSTSPCYKPTDVWGEIMCSYSCWQGYSQSGTVSFQVDGGNFNSGVITWGPANMSATSWTGVYYLPNMMSTPTGTLTYNGLDIPPGMSFRVGVSCSSSGEITWSNIYPVLGSGCVNKAGGASISTSTPSLSVYPNPSNGVFRLALTEEATDPSEIIVTDMSGRTILTQTFEHGEAEATVDMTGKAAGVYFLKFNGETKKIVLR